MADKLGDVSYDRGIQLFFFSTVFLLKLSHLLDKVPTLSGADTEMKLSSNVEINNVKYGKARLMK